MTTTTDIPTDDELLLPCEVAEIFRVNPKSVTRWAKAGKLTAVKTLSGHRRFRRSEVERVYREAQGEA